jgi:hypothetical protein
LALLRGFGVTAVKSAALLSESAQPSAFLMTALVALGAGARAPSKQFAVEPKPTKSTTDPPVGHEPVSAAVVLVSATLPAVADICVVPVASAGGRSVVPPVPCASRTR